MAQQAINLGSSANDGTGDTFRAAFDKVNDNFTELYAAGGGDLDMILVGQTGTATTGSTWTYTTDVANVDVTGLGGYDIIEGIVRNVSASSSGQRAIIVGTGAGPTYYTTSGDYVNVPASGSESNTLFAAAHASATTAARSLWFRITGNQTDGPKLILQKDSVDRLFVATLTDPITALRLLNYGGSYPSGTGNLTGGSLYIRCR